MAQTRNIQETITAYATTASVDGNGMSWSNESGALTDGGIAANVSGNSTSPITEILYVHNFQIDLPPKSTVLGIEAFIKRQSEDEGKPFYDEEVYLTTSLNGSSDSDNKSQVGDWPTSYSTAVYGGPADMWGSGFDQADIEGSSFGLGIVATRNSTGLPYNQADVDLMYLKITYEYNVAQIAPPTNATQQEEIADST